MKFFKWLFSVTQRHHGDFARYEKGKIGTRIFVIFLLLIFTGVTLGLTYWCINLFKENLPLGIVVLLFLVIPFSAATIEYNGVYSAIGFRMFLRGTVISIAKKVDAIAQPDVIDVPTKEERSEKAHKWIDLFVAILGIILSVGLIVAMIVMFAVLLK